MGDLVAEGLELADEVAGLAGGVEMTLVPVGTEFLVGGVRVVDQVQAADEVTGEITISPVTDVIIGNDLKDLVTLSVDADGSGTPEPLTATAGHPFFVQGRGWVDTSDILAGDRLLAPDGGTATIVQSTHTEAVAQVRNLTVASSHTYYVAVDGQAALVHNCARRIPKKRGRKDLRTPTKYKSKQAAVSAARRDARVGGRCRSRGVCSSGNHVHVDYFNRRGQISHIRHYNW